jgi:cell cycle sensor histidine kinase DivJ
MALAAPFFLSAALAFASYQATGAAMTAAALCSVCGLCWLGAIMVAAALRQDVIEWAALALGVLLGGAVLAAAGGLASPLTAMLGALLFETWWVRRGRGAAAVGAAVVVAAVAAAIAVPAVVDLPSVSPSAWQWLVPLVYSATVGLRLQRVLVEAREAAAESSEPSLETMVDAVVLRLAANGDVQTVSAQSRRIFALAPELLLGSAFFDRVHVADRIGYLSALADLREGAAFRRADLRLRLPQLDADRQSDNYRLFSAELVNAGDGRDLVMLVRENDEVGALREAVAAATENVDSMATAKNRFLATVSHELRTPLNAILGFSDMLLHEMFGPFPDPRQKEYVGLINESGNHLLSVVNSILDVSKIESGAYPIYPEPFQFGDAVDMCRSMMAHQAAAKSIALRVAVAAGAGEVRADRRAVRQILINLVSNAVKFTGEGGTVVIGAQRAGSRLRFWVSDNGIGISEDDLKRLGQPFMQVHNDYTRHFEGTGLGLSLVKGLVALHDGAMTIESAPGEGTTVTVTLPVAGPRSSGGKDCVAAAATETRNEAQDESERKTA